MKLLMDSLIKRLHENSSLPEVEKEERTINGTVS